MDDWNLARKRKLVEALLACHCMQTPQSRDQIIGDLPAETVIALATGNNARAFRLDTGTLAVGRPADLVVCDAPAASMAPDALTAIARGDIPGISAVVIDGEVQVGRSRNTPLAKRLATIAGAVVVGAGH